VLTKRPQVAFHGARLGVLPVNYLLVFGVAVFSSASGALFVAFLDLRRRRELRTSRSGDSAGEEATSLKTRGIADRTVD
jgi:hypothetical protein